MISDAEMFLGMARFAAFAGVLALVISYVGLAVRALQHPRGGWRTLLNYLWRNAEAVFLLGILWYYVHQMFGPETGTFRFPRFLPTVDNLININILLGLYFFFRAWPGRNRRYEDWLRSAEGERASPK
jgi:hypothetical protein